MKIMRTLCDDQPVWAIIDGEIVYRLQGDIYGSPEKGASIGPLAGLKILGPLLPENKVIVLLENWRSKDNRDGPGFLVKPPNARINPGETVIYPKIASKVWFETELGIVIGKRSKSITPQHARQHILGYTVSNDITAFELTKKTNDPAYVGKGFDTFCVVGPCIATDLDPTNLLLQGFINGKQYFEKNTGLMLWNAYEVVSWVSQIMTLFPGDVISCGACAECLTELVHVGDRIGVGIEGIGKFENPVCAE
jgi:5-oxopent-3-ene-1,2,5-tricarboxylate decarboxylase / 2-hydroxyhepta-2,4-diene-1,7-dioate isomerase